jgi:hypothetical protein
MVILHVLLEVAGEFVDAGGQKGHLDFGRASVSGGTLILGDNLSLVDVCNGHGFPFNADGTDMRSRKEGRAVG